ncbi:MAG TPA: ABC transporter substrate-binding protein [Terriglobia bacterium]|nr:ABC transporter substrate-binding protein [Terriglobia bacterium]
MTRLMRLVRPAAAVAVLTVLAAAGAMAAVADEITVPDAIKQAGKLEICSDISGPPLGYFDENGKPVGVEIDLGAELAKRLGVTASWNNTQFDGIIPALQAKHCDVIMSQLFDKPARREVVDFVDYMKASESILVDKGNPQQIKSLEDLSGRKIAVENGTTIQSLIDEQNKKFAAAGKPPAQVIVYPKDSDALQALQFKQVDAYGTTLESASYFITKAPDVFEVSGEPFAQMTVGAAFRKDDQALRNAFAAALEAMQKDGTYLAILKHWNLQGDAYP